MGPRQPDLKGSGLRDSGQLEAWKTSVTGKEELQEQLQIEGVYYSYALIYLTFSTVSRSPNEGCAVQTSKMHFIVFFIQADLWTLKPLTWCSCSLQPLAIKT